MFGIVPCLLCAIKQTALLVLKHVPYTTDAAAKPPAAPHLSAVVCCSKESSPHVFLPSTPSLLLILHFGIVTCAPAPRRLPSLPRHPLHLLRRRQRAVLPPST